MKDIFLSQIIFLFSASNLFSVAERLCPRRTRRQNMFRMMSSTTIFQAKFENRKDILLSQIIFRHHDHECNYIICIPALPISPSFSVPKYSCVPANRGIFHLPSSRGLLMSACPSQRSSLLPPGNDQP